MSNSRSQAANQRRNEKIQRQLDEALEDSFPASDPVSIVTSQGEEDWGEEREDPGATPAPPGETQDVKAPSAPGSSRPD